MESAPEDSVFSDDLSIVLKINVQVPSLMTMTQDNLKELYQSNSLKVGNIDLNSLIQLII